MALKKSSKQNDLYEVYFIADGIPHPLKGFPSEIDAIKEVNYLEDEYGRCYQFLGYQNVTFHIQKVNP